MKAGIKLSGLNSKCRLPNIPAVNCSHGSNMLWGSLSISRDRETGQGLQEPDGAQHRDKLIENEPLSGLNLLLKVTFQQDDTKHKCKNA